MNPAHDFLERLDSAFWSPSQRGYVEVVENGKAGKDLAFNWSVGVVLTALNSAAETEPSWADRLRQYMPTVTRYWNDAPPVPGFDVLPVPKPMDRFYDDNAWMVMALIESAHVLKEPVWIDWASKSLGHVLSGMDDKLGGGIYWKEAEKTSKNTCSNAPSAAACLALHKVKPSPHLVQTARNLYDWTKLKLQDPSDKLYWDNLGLDGKIGKMKWSYNSALMIRSALGLYRETKEANFLEDAKALAKASTSYWIKPDGTIQCEGRFAHLLVECLTELEAETKEKFFDRDAVRRSLERRMALGWIPKRWDAPMAAAQGRVELLDQAATVRAWHHLKG